MATLEQKQELIEVLKFTPRTYKVSMWGYGGEKVMGTVDQEVWDYCMENQVDLSDIAWNHDIAEEIGLDENKLPFTPGSWYECDNMGHVSGVSRDAGTIQIEDENGVVVFEKSLGECDGDNSPGLSCNDEVWAGARKPGEIVFSGSSNEKGTFFEGDIELTAPFDIEKLELQYDDFDGEDIVNGLMYDGEDIDNYGGSTDGKSSDFNMVRITGEDGSFERYEPEAKDWGTPECGTSPNDWEKSPAFKFSACSPVHIGWYSCVWRNFGTTYGSLYWNGEEFGEFEYGKFKPVSGTVQTWQGYNWDTTDWGNQPPEPPDVSCDNKACGWVGDSEDRITDDDYTDHCPLCNGTEFSWIDYDPETKEGKKNREKYCEPTKEEKQAFMAALDRALIELVEDNTGETVVPKSSWPF